MLQSTSSMEIVYSLSQSYLLSLPKGPFFPTYSFYYLLTSFMCCGCFACMLSRFPGTGIADHYDLPCGCWESSLALFKEQWELLNTWAPPHVSQMGLLSCFDWSSPSPSCLRLLSCWFPLEPVALLHELLLLLLLFLALCLAIKTFWVICFFF